MLFKPYVSAAIVGLSLVTAVPTAASAPETPMPPCEAWWIGWSNVVVCTVGDVTFGCYQTGGPDPGAGCALVSPCPDPRHGEVGVDAFVAGANTKACRADVWADNPTWECSLDGDGVSCPWASCGPGWAPGLGAGCVLSIPGTTCHQAEWGIRGPVNVGGGHGCHVAVWADATGIITLA